MVLTMRIPRCSTDDNPETGDRYTMYAVVVLAGKQEWQVLRRYSQFRNLHDRMALSLQGSGITLPPKKYVSNMTVGFVERRRKLLEKYLQDAYAVVGPIQPLITFVGAEWLLDEQRSSFGGANGLVTHDWMQHTSKEHRFLRLGDEISPRDSSSPRDAAADGCAIL